MAAYDLYDKGLYLDAAGAIDGAASVPRDLRVLRALLESHVGAPRSARDAAINLLQDRLNSREQSMCLEALGRVSLSGGQISDGLRTMGKALDAATATQDARRFARLIASYTESLLHCVGVDAAILEIPRLRQAAVRAGDAFSLIEFHSIEAEVKAKRGLFSSAASSIDIARELLGRFPNASQQARIAVVATGMLIVQGDYRTALTTAAEALTCARTTGLRTVLIPALNNLAYINLTLGDLDNVEPLLDEMQRLHLRGSPTEVGTLDTRMMLALAGNDMTRANELAGEIADLLSVLEERDSYYELWHLPTRVRWLYRSGKVDEGLHLARQTLPRAEQRRDQLLIARLHMLAADGFDRMDAPFKAAESIAAAITSTADPSIELLAEGRRVAGRLAARLDATSPAEALAQANSLFASIGNSIAQRELGQELGNFPPTPRPGRDDSNSRALGRISTVVEVGGHAPSLANEISRLLIDNDLVLESKLTLIDANGRQDILAAHKARPASDAGTIDAQWLHINCGTQGKMRFELVCLPKPDAAARLDVLAVERLAIAAMGLASFRQISREKIALWPDPTAEQQLGLICSSERMLDLVKTIRRVAASNVTVLLTGETGVGKELFARALHQASARSDKPFLPFNCGTVPRDLLDSQLFGHRRGAFTGAHADAPGVIRSAAGGTLFLDEIGEMPMETQPRLLRFLEAGEILPLGEAKPLAVDVRIVAATNANLDQMVAEGRFREDLYYRLNVIRINIPPLRERREEIPALVEHFLDRFGHELQKPMLRVADETLEYLVLYRWPGNVRQLANEIRRMVALAEANAVLMPAHLSDDIVASRRTIPAGSLPRGFSEVVTRIDQPLAAAVEHIERAAIQRAMAVSDGNLIEAAKMLGLSRKGLYLKRQRLGLG
jgi:DNA-binding NtrC family response regulator